MMDRCLTQVIEVWDKSKYVCFFHCTKEEAVAATNRTLARGAVEIPDFVSVSNGAVLLFPRKAVKDMVSSRLHAGNRLRCKSWVVALPGIPPKTITSVVLDVPQTHDDPFLQTYAPHHALPGCVTLHFFDYERAVAILGPLMDVD
jgi:hypothetical protein